MSSQTYDLHRALLRPAIVHILRAAGFHSTKPTVLDTVANLAERYLMLLAQTTAAHAISSHNDPVPTITDVRMALAECGALSPLSGAAEEDWKERMRRPMSEIEAPENGGLTRAQAEKKRREEEDLKDVRDFMRWFESSQHTEMRRIAGLIHDASATGAATAPTIGVGGGVVQAEDYLQVLKSKQGKSTADIRFQGSALGHPGEDRTVVIEGGPVGSLRDWKPPQTHARPNVIDLPAAKEVHEDESMGGSPNGILEDSTMEDASVID
jgi:transcription initiation factor TFIID subunit 3